MKKYFIFYIYHFCIQILVRYLTHRLTLKSDFSTSSSSSVLDESENLQKKT